MMNTLANHGFLHRDGLNLTEDVVIKALQDGLNFDTSLSKTMFKMALPANPDPNATWFTLYVSGLLCFALRQEYQLTPLQRPTKPPQRPRTRRQPQVNQSPKPYHPNPSKNPH